MNYITKEIASMISAKRDAQTIKAKKCKKCACVPVIAENAYRTLYWVRCFCGKETKGFSKIDDAVEDWNANN